MQETNRTRFALVGAVIAALAASLCCLLPAIAIALGVAGFAAAEVFASWRPYLLAATFALLGLGFYLAYRRLPAVVSEDGCACEPTSLGRWNRIMLWVASVLVIAFAAFPYYGGAVVRSVGNSKRQAAAATSNSLAHVTLKIEGMDCPVCAAGLQNNLRQIPGVRRAEVNFQDKQASIDYDSRAVDPARLEQAVKDSGFKVASPRATSN